MSRRPWRVTTPMGKVAYVVAATIIGVFLVLLLAASPLPDVVVSLVAAVYFVAWIVVGARVFRGPGEQVEAPRAWWRMTSRPWAGFVLAALFGLGVVVPAGTPSSAAQGVAQLAVAAAYLVSSVVLARRRARSVPVGEAGTIEAFPPTPGDAPE